MSLPATDPRLNATVSASAGSGKTWLLVTRIIRLLLDGNEPGNILALTFTRKAAAEMNLRLNSRLYELATAGTKKLDELLDQAGAATDDATRAAARTLYERVLFADYPIRMQTFHSFCQEVLGRFAMEADVPPGFELLEDTGLLRRQAWEKLFAEATREPDGELGIQLDLLMDRCNGPPNTRTALHNMLAHRSDWWAFTENQARPVAFARDRLAEQLDIEPGSDRFVNVFFDRHRGLLLEFCDLLRLHPTKTNVQHADTIESVLADAAYDMAVIDRLATAFLTKAGPPLARKRNDTLAKKLGDAGTERFLDLHESLSGALLDTIDIARRHDAFWLNAAWYLAGDRLIGFFQQLKRDLRLLDFTDLEWHCYRLLHDADNAMWVQYKLDQRIDHILIDEFQDTNPTQWQLLAPLLEEMAASRGDEDAAERRRSVFLVGDEKQSIYSFRRANPALQEQVSAWLRDNLDASATPLDRSWRSSPVIMDFVNAVFGLPAAAGIMTGFSPHGTHRDELPGSVTLLPEFSADDADDETPAFRNPLHEPRVIHENNARLKEAGAIAENILKLKNSGRIDNYSDVMLLMRNRTHMQQYERVLREHGIPFLSDRRGGLLDRLEVQDMERLLDVLITPYDNLALAQVLKSPLFDVTDDELLQLARTPGDTHWYERLQALAPELDENSALGRAALQLASWRLFADTMPVHDLLAHIYAEAHVIARYRARAGERARQVCANLERFIELSLEVEAGRYPGLAQFKHYLRGLREHAENPLRLPEDGDSVDRVRIMTIHASKGLEAPVVFLADCNAGGRDKNAWGALVEWPEQATRPTVFRLQVDQAKLDSRTRDVIDNKQRKLQREALNLLYVAMTRARQYLFVSAVDSGNSGWYALLAEAMSTLDPVQENLCSHIAFDNPDYTADASQKEPAAAINPGQINPAAFEPARTPIKPRLLLPSRVEEEPAEATAMHGDLDEAKLRGLIVHRLLDLLSATPPASVELATAVIAREFTREPGDELVAGCVAEAVATRDSPELADLFEPPDGAQCYNEIPLLYERDGQGVFGYVDRLVVDGESAVIADYKSRRLAAGDDPERLARDYAGQLALYREGVAKLWPGKSVRCCVVFTDGARRIWLS